MSTDKKRDWDNKAFADDVGHKAAIERWTADGDDALNMNYELQKIGQQIKHCTNVLREAEYLGSVAIHYFQTPLLKQPYFVCQPGAIGKVPEHLVQLGITDLRNELLQVYGHNAQRKRSGW